MRYSTVYDPPPIPDRRYDWTAVVVGYDIGDPIGMGPTENDALRDLLEQIEEAKP